MRGFYLKGKFWGDPPTHPPPPHTLYETLGSGNAIFFFFFFFWTLNFSSSIFLHLLHVLSLFLICFHSLHSCFISTRAILPYLSLCYHRQLRRPDWLLRCSFRAKWRQHCLFEQLTSCSPPSTSATPRLLKPPPTTLEPSRGSSR